MALQYLLSPTFQFVNTAGKPMTGGAYLEVYVHGTRNKYFCASDFNGTLHPFRIPLDSLGSNIVLAQDGQAYDVYAYNRYGNLMMSRYNITPGSGGGGIGGIIYSSDGSVQVIPTENGIDLSVNGIRPTVLKVGAAPLGTDGQFVFDALQVEGEGLSVDNAGRIRMQPGWYHYDVTVELAWDENPRNASSQISLYTTLSRSVIDFDLSFQHTETIQFSGDVHCVEEGAQMVFGVSGMPTGLVASVTDAGMHSITGKTGDGSRYLAGEGINIDASNNISVDFGVVQPKLTAGSNISIVGNTISATAEPQQPADWAATEGVTRILNKPNLDIYATHSEVTYGLAQKQDTISDLSTIRSGAAAGATAVQPSEMDSALATKQDVISDLATIRSGAAKGATSVQPADLAPYAVASDVETALAGKQDVINDLSTIRSGASAGATAVQPATMNSALAGKQDTISDLSTIRSGAASGATAVQPSTMNAALAGKQNVIYDLSDIRSGAAAGTTAVQPADMNTALAGKQDVISDLATIRSGAAAGATAVQPADMDSAIAGKENASNKSQTLDPTSTTQFPSSAATASFVNSSVATNTATFRGNFKLPDLGLTYPATNAQIEAALDAHTWPVGVVPTNNDYVYVEIENPQTTGIDDVVKRFKFNGTDWHYEYTLNNSSFTAAEKAAIDSGIDSAKVAIYDAHVANGGIHVTTAEKTTWNAKQNAISDLSTIRSGAAAGATAVQDPDYVHTDNNFTTAEKTKLSGIEAGAQVNVNADWNAASGTDAYIANKPQNLVQDASYVHTDENFTSSDKSKLAGIEAGAQVNVKPDWNAAAGSDDEILNKPAIPSGTQLVPAATSADSSKVLTVNSIGTPEWAAAQAPISAGSGIDITSNTVSAKVDGTTVTVNGSGQLQATQPTVDQTYNSASANAQSGTAVAGAIAGKEDEFSAGDGLEFTSDGQGNRVLQVEAPVDIVAGPGIVIDNPDGNTLRVSVAQTEEVVLWEGTAYNAGAALAMSENCTNFEKLQIYGYAHEAGQRKGVILAWPYAVDTEIGVTLTFSTITYSTRLKITTGGNMSVLDHVNYWQSGSAFAFGTDGVVITKVVGIHRIASN